MAINDLYSQSEVETTETWLKRLKSHDAVKLHLCHPFIDAHDKLTPACVHGVVPQALPKDVVLG